MSDYKLSADSVGSGVDQERVKKAVREILFAIGEDPDRPGLVETPDRVARMYEEIFAGLHNDVRDSIKVFNEPDNDEMILVGDIPFYSMCEHHLLPFVGRAHVVYIPHKGKILGLSKIARIVDMMSRKPQLQERMTSQIADMIVEAVDPLGVAVVLEAEHLCMTMRGIKKPGSETVTSALRGLCKKDARSRSEAMDLIHRK
ncbi:MAG: GTP cyclohydrolase I FolE [Eubacteriales bacterium]|nr:GTP cyclohydrolase I FolE [Eubacteriales bacterium]MDD3196698.1 GTP cyclohydrolase I FolE [Eubacteriales bacterium]MDD4681954.1 GTP cyclohydrolase I FolE [Eubacteriales bacterium]